MLSFFSFDSGFRIRPSASTTSSPSAISRATPYANAAVPPALVERLPPMVQLPSAASDSGNSRSISAAFCCATCSTTPASQVMVLEAASISRILSSRRIETTTSPLRGLAADQAGIAALRHQRDSVFAGELADRRDFRGRARAQHQRRAAVKQVALLGEVGRDVGGIRHGVFVADHGAKACDQLRRKRRCGSGGLDGIHGCVSFYYCLLSSRVGLQLRPIAARRRRSLIASPRP